MYIKCYTVLNFFIVVKLHVKQREVVVENLSLGTSLPTPPSCLYCLWYTTSSWMTKLLVGKNKMWKKRGGRKLSGGCSSKQVYFLLRQIREQPWHTSCIKRTCSHIKANPFPCLFFVCLFLGWRQLHMSLKALSASLIIMSAYK